MFLCSLHSSYPNVDYPYEKVMLSFLMLQNNIVQRFTLQWINVSVQKTTAQLRKKRHELIMRKYCNVLFLKAICWNAGLYFVGGVVIVIVGVFLLSP